MELVDRGVVECPLCAMPYSVDRPPLCTPCGHSFCSYCAGELSGPPSNRRSFNCPLCDERCDPGENGLRRNVALHALLDEIAEAKQRAVRVQRAPEALDNSEGKSCTLGDDWKYLRIDFSELKPEALIDTGAFGEVHRCRWRGGLVAAKLIRSGEIALSLLEGFRREVEVMSVLHHPNIVLMLGACAEPPRLCLVMELMSGGSLYGLLHVNSVKLEPVETRSLALDIAHGLQYLHSLNILHRDLKSKNVLLTRSLPRVAKLCDFGLSRVRAEAATMTGKIGTPQWTAPEVLIGSKYSFSADIYSFGMVLFEMVSLRLPYAGLHPMAAIMAVAIKKQPPDFLEEIEPELKNLITQCICWVASDRLSMRQVLLQLEAYKPPPLRQDSLLYKTLQSLDRQDSGTELEHSFASLVYGAAASAAAPCQAEWTESYWEAREKKYREDADLVCAVHLQELTDEGVSKDKAQQKLDSLIAYALEHGSSLGRHASWTNTSDSSSSREDGCHASRTGTELYHLSDVAEECMSVWDKRHSTDCTPDIPTNYSCSEKRGPVHSEHFLSPTDQLLEPPQLGRRGLSPLRRMKSYCAGIRQQLGREIREFQREMLRPTCTVEYVNLPDRTEYLQAKLEEIIRQLAHEYGHTNPTLVTLMQGCAAVLEEQNLPAKIKLSTCGEHQEKSASHLEMTFELTWQLYSMLDDSSTWIRLLCERSQVKEDLLCFDKSLLKKTTMRCLSDLRWQLFQDIHQCKSFRLRNVKTTVVRSVVVIVEDENDNNKEDED